MELEQLEQLEQLTWCAPASPARPSPWRVSAEVALMIAGSGRRRCGSSGSTGRDACFWRTYLDSSHWDWTGYLGTWTLRATKAGRWYIRLRLSARPTAVSGSSSSPSTDRAVGWLTPSASDALGSRTLPAGTSATGRRPDGKKAMVGLPNQVHQVGQVMWPTPDAGGFNQGEDLEQWRARRARVKETARNGNGMGTPLGVAVRLWPTIRATDGDHGGPNQRDSAGNPGLPGAVRAPVGGKLNPAWVEQLMGFPDGWTELLVLDGPPDPVKSSMRGKRRASPARRSPSAPSV